MQHTTKFNKKNILLILAPLIAVILYFIFFQQPSIELREGNILQTDKWFRFSWQPHGEIKLDKSVIHNSTSHSIRIKSTEGNDISYTQWVPVVKGRYYRFSSWIKTEEVQNPGFATLSVLGGFNHGMAELKGNTPWTFVEEVFRAERDENAQFALRLGYYGSNAIGTAWFSDPQLVEMETWDGHSIPILAKPEAVKKEEKSAEKEGTKLSAVPLRLFIILLLIPFVLIFVYLSRHGFLDRKDILPIKKDLTPLWREPAFWALIGIALCVRLVMIRYSGFTIDTDLYIMWAFNASEPGRLLEIYPANPKDYFIDYPPLYLYVLALVGWIGQALSLDHNSPLMYALLKTPPVIMDLVVTGLLLSYCRRRFGGYIPWLLAALFALNPVVIFDSTFWGQTDVVYVAMVMISLLLMERQKIVAAGMFLAASFAMKPQAVVFILFFIVFAFRYYPIKTVLISGFAAFGTFVLAILPFAYNRPFFWIVDLYQNTAEGYSYLSVNAYNFWSMLGLNWTKADTTGFLGISASIWSIVVPVLVFAAVIGVLLIGPRTKDTQIADYSDVKKVNGSRWQPESLFPAFYLLAFAFFMFFPRMHERYLYPAILFMLPLLPMVRRLHWIYLGTILLLFFNLAYTFYYYIYLDTPAPANNWIIQTISSGLFILFIFSFIHELRARSQRVAGFLQRLTETSSRTGKALFKLPRKAISSARSLILSPAEAAFRMKKWDYLAVSLLWLFSLGLLLFRLGDLNYPTHPFQIPSEPIEIEVQFSPPVSIGQVDFYDGINDGELVTEYLSNTGWEPLFNDKNKTLELKEFYKVIEKKVTYSGKIERLRLSGIKGSNAEILELGIFSPDGQQILPAKIIERGPEGERVLNPKEHPLFDEPETLRKGGGYLRSTYFDEIYHGRTALEFLRDIRPYETTHPPLGKVLIGMGIRAFDMTPFGWRFVGVFFGASMVWLLFAGGRLLTKRRSGAYIAASLIAFDFLIFSLSRYSTIDVILAFFITASYLALYYWYSLGQGRMVSGSVRWFIVSGACIGCAIATKWSGLYAGFGLFLFIMWISFREWGMAAGKKWGGYSSSYTQFWQEHVLRFGAITILCFILIPTSVYCLSYIEFLESHQGGPSLFSLAGVERVITYQTHMFDYHANQGADAHPFTSPYYTWPVIGKPLWVYVDSTMQRPLRSSIALLGNPAIWWPGLLVMLALLWKTTGKITKEMIFLVCAYLIQFIPWMSVERTTFIYHYVPSVPFMVLAIALIASKLDLSRWVAKITLTMYLGLVLFMFALFYSAISGLPVSIEHSDRLHWFSSWNIL